MGKISMEAIPDYQFVGRGEMLVKQLLTNPFGIKTIRPQIPLYCLISNEDFKFFDEEIRKHKFDFVLYRKNGEKIAVEVNYQHGPKADFKSNRIFEKVLKKNNVFLLRIDDYECTHLFRQNSKGIHKKTTDDMRDILNAMDIAGINMI